MTQSAPLAWGLLRWWLWLFGAVLYLGTARARAANPVLHPAGSIDELRQRLDAIRTETHTPGLSVAIVRGSEVEWTAGLGVVNTATGDLANDDTLFRVGSISKGFVALAVLQLVSQGKVSLLASVRELAPEVAFDNPWEASDPVLVADLLEHTTGWDDVHLREMAKDARGMTLREALDFNPRSRTSRWRPGTRSAYCNSGPAVAAYIVEKVSGTRFEDYVRQNLLEPIGMVTATYWEEPSPRLTTLYHTDGVSPHPYWNALFRPSGALNASAKDMAAYLQFLLARGTVRHNEIVPASALDLMDLPTRNWAVRQGAQTGDGLGSGTSVRQGFSYRGHSGGVPGGLALMEYLNEARVGYYYAINSKNEAAFARIGAELRAYLTSGLVPAPPPVTTAATVDANDYVGWYEPAATRFAINDYAERLLGLRRVSWQEGRLHLRNLAGQDLEFALAGGNLLHFQVKSGPPSPAATSALIPPTPDGRFVYMEGWLKRVPTWIVVVRLGLLGGCLTAMGALVLITPLVWFRKAGPTRATERSLVQWPLLGIVNLVAFGAIGMPAHEDPVAVFGHVTPLSLGLVVASSLLAVAASISSFVWVRSWRASARPWVRLVTLIATCSLVITVAYLAQYGLIGVRTWA